VFEVQADVRGGGTTGQLDAVSLGLSRGIVGYYEGLLNELVMAFYVLYLLAVLVGFCPLRPTRKLNKSRLNYLVRLGTGIKGLDRSLGGMRSFLRFKGHLIPDLRHKERKKYGLKKARKAPQYSKR
jgi:ribosomal protein S9